MSPIKLEERVLRILDSVKAGRFIEDSLVEIKAEWPETAKAARQIGGHANAARGSSILWIIGVDEKGGVIGVDFSELSSWHSKVEAQFDGLAPPMVLSINVPDGDVIVAALVFETDRAPYVIKNSDFNKPGGGRVEYEVPWREGTRTRSARRRDLIKMLAPLQEQPVIEVRDCRLTLGSRKSATTVARFLSLAATFYIIPRSEQPVVFPYHRISAEALVVGSNKSLAIGSIRFVDGSAPGGGFRITSLATLNQPSPVTVKGQFEMLEITQSEILLRGPRSVKIYGSAPLGETPIEESASIKFTLQMNGALENMACTITCSCGRVVAEDGTILWKS